MLQIIFSAPHWPVKTQAQRYLYSIYFFKGFYSGKCRKVHIDFRRISMKDIPSDPEGQRTFMYNIFKRKDK